METQQKSKKPTQKQLAQAFRVSTRTVSRFLKPRPIPKLGRKLKITGRTLSRLCLYALVKEGKTQKELAELVYQKTGERISQATVSRALRRKDITHKKLAYHYMEQSKYANEIKEFTEITIPSLSQSRILATDECSFRLNEVPRFGYSEKGSKAVRRKPGKRGSNYTLVLCVKNVTSKTAIHYKLIEKGIKSKSFHEFLSDIKLPANEKHYLLMDNLPVHKATDSCRKLKLSTIRELLVSKNIEPIYLPSYTPQLNPVELCFNNIRHNIEKSRSWTYEELKSAIDKEIANLQKENLTPYFRHCFEYFDELKEKARRKERLLSKFTHHRSRQIGQPWLSIHPEIYPSRRWMKLGTKPSFKKIKSVQEKIEKYYEKAKIDL